VIGNASEFTVRRVVHGTDADGRSTVLEDAVATHRVETPAFTIVDLWRINGLPASLLPKDGLPDGVELTPPPSSGVFRMCAIAPDEEWAGRPMSDSLEAIGHAGGPDSGAEDSAVHATDTLDVVVVLSGEVNCNTDTHETLLKAGDVVVQTGNRHSWSNRSGKVCVVAFIMLGAIRD
jgi:mannose-6-phosphate isomerase-like protein (cupin superfamily)